MIKNGSFPSVLVFLAPGEPSESLKWRIRIIQRCKWFSGHLWRQWFAIYERDGYVQANLWLTKIYERLKLAKTGLFIDAGDEEIADYANAKTRMIALDSRDALKRLDKKTALSTIKTLFERTGLVFPVEERFWLVDYNPKKLFAALARIEDPRWLARQLRKKATRDLEAICRELGIVRRGTAPYLSDITLKRFFFRQAANRNLLEKMVATNDLGQQFTLAELSDLGVSNPAIRRTELMVRLRGFETWAENDKRDWAPWFFTITTPSKYHPMSGSSGSIKPNPKFCGATPSNAQHYLNKLWQRARAELARKGIEFFGFRVAEPHHDGTPHWHLLLFVTKEHEQTLIEVLRGYAMAEDGTEPGASKHRFEAVRIDPEKGSATGYVAKYIAKNIDGYKVDIDDEAEGAATITAIRACAWASVWGIRQFQQLGGPPVTPWRELRRDSDIQGQLPETLNVDEKRLLAIHQAADEGDWAAYVELMGGGTCKRAELPLRANYFIEPESGRYDEDVAKFSGLLLACGREIKTRLRTWTITMGEKLSPENPENGFLRTGPPGAAPLEFCQ
ncbi:MAG: replication endonuclease [Candidatus Reddybacter sp.]